MREIGIERFRPGDAQNNRRKNHNRRKTVVQEEFHGEVRAKRANDARMSKHRCRAGYGNRCEPYHHHGAKQFADFARATAL